MPKCKHKHGLLILRECGRDTDSRCQNCGKPICADHTTRHGDHPVCYDCKSALMDRTEGADGYARQAYMRNHYYGSIGGYAPLYSRRYRDWDGDYDDGDYEDSDYDTFDGEDATMGYDDFDDMGEDDFSDS